MSSSQTLPHQHEHITPVIVEIENGIGWITLNREKALNSLNDEMVCLLSQALQDWEKDSSVHAVIVQGKGRAFCAGGDIRNFYHNKQTGHLEKSERFFKDEYRLNKYIGNYGKPYISLIDGINMGGGMGISIHGSHRLVTENARLAMPETTIGFHTDVGASYFLSRLQDNLGIYLGLTGVHIKGEDALFAGLVTHYVESHRLSKIIASLKKDRVSKESFLPYMESLLKTHSSPPPHSFLKENLSIIRSCFAATTIDAILENLLNNGSPFATQTYEELKTKSPSSLRVVLQALLNAQHLDFSDCMTQELRLSHAFIQRHDFAEGVRALLIDKDKNPRWQPSTLQEVTPDMVQSYFKPLKNETL